MRISSMTELCSSQSYETLPILVDFQTMKNQESRVGPEQEIESVPQYETSAKNQVSNNQSIKTKKK